jgi:hypothetical protein
VVAKQLPAVSPAHKSTIDEHRPLCLSLLVSTIAVDQKKNLHDTHYTAHESTEDVKQYSTYIVDGIGSHQQTRSGFVHGVFRTSNGFIH